MSDLLSKLNPEQHQAVTLPATHGLILAGAGSGKTRVLTTRIAWLISTNQASPHSILAVTFTNKAAKEMVARLSALLPINTRSMWIGTFHGLCNRLLRAHYQEAGLPALFQILDNADQLSAIKRLLKNLNVDEERFPPRELMHFINAHKEQGVRAAQAEAFDEFSRRRVSIYAEYEAQCQREGVVDFAELLLRTYELLCRHEPLRQHYQQRFRHILVDEFQDTNRLQYSWLKLLAGGGAAVLAVGDDDQSIYGFRGAEVGNMREFEQDFAKSNVIRLEQNYRSHGNILNAANAIIKHNSQRLGKNLWTDAGDGEPLRFFSAFSDVEEARFVVDEVKALLNEGMAREQVAILYRSNAQSRVLEHELFSRGVPYRVYGGLRFFERQEIKHALAYLRLLANPDDDTAFLRVVNFPTRGIGSRTVESLQTLAHQSNSSLYNAAASLGGRSGASVAKFVQMIESLRQATRQLPLAEQVEHVLVHSTLRQHYEKEKEGAERLANLDELINAATVFVQEQQNQGQDSSHALIAFLTHATLEAGEHQAEAGQTAIQMMSIHAAKGLEFNVVFITGLEQGLFPHDNATADGIRGLEEERRLMYVAMTRARQRLYLSLAQSRMLHGQTRYAAPSLFLDEIPANLIKRLNTVSANSSSNSHFASSPRPATSSASGVKRGAARGIVLEQGLHLGQKVFHEKFGDGVILDAKDSKQILVKFATQGEKWLSLQFAKLSPR